MPISARHLALQTAAVCLMFSAPSAQAQDFFSELFGGMTTARPRAPIQVPFANDGQPGDPSGDTASEGQPRRARAGGGSQAFCVRTCDGRYFPIMASDGQSRAASCSSFCPASETKVVYGSSIDQASTDKGKPYSELPNAFRYRKELVSGCTCNGKDSGGLAAIKIENDPTLRKGDIVAGADGLMVNHNAPDRRGASLNMSPASPAIRSAYARLPVMAQD